jgi:hypothetical protein
METFRHILQWAFPIILLIPTFRGAYKETKQCGAFHPANGMGSLMTVVTITIVACGTGAALLVWLYSPGK